MIVSRKIILVWRSKLRTVPNNSYGFLKCFESDLRDFLSRIWRRNARSAHHALTARVYAYACVRAQLPKRSMPLSLVHLPRTRSDRATRCEIASDVGTLISVTGDNEPSKGCRVS